MRLMVDGRLTICDQPFGVDLHQRHDAGKASPPYHCVLVAGTGLATITNAPSLGHFGSRIIAPRRGSRYIFRVAGQRGLLLYRTTF
jgi:hypothetical protein